MKFFIQFNSLLSLSLQFSPIDHHESAAKILFNAMNWPKTIPAFTALTNSDQVESNESFATLDFLSLSRLFSCYYWKKIGVIYFF